MKFHELEIQSVEENTKNAVFVEFSIPNNLQNNYTFQPGQHVTLDFKIERNAYRRTYSICSAPHENKFCISVKRLEKGIISNYINDAFFKGFKVKVSEPYGSFYTDEQIIKAANLVLWAGGSGITPMISIAKHVLFAFPDTQVQLVYANSNQNSIMFETEIEALKYKFSGNFSAIQILSNNELPSGIFSKFCSFNGPKKEWIGLTGYIDNHLITDIVYKLPKAVHYICGPAKMMEICENSLVENKITDVHVERFSNTNSVQNNNKNAVLKVKLNKHEHEINLGDNNILEAMLANKLDPPYACKTGTCGSCKAILVSGEVVSARDFALNEADKEAGKILCCQSWSLSAEVQIKYN
jgi:ring-1,2-phenylacetyl-CoA epoxidase subunit PaaE